MDPYQNWLTFLQAEGAEPNSAGLIDFAMSTGSSPTLCALTGYQLLDIIGPDAQKFLQGQVTCDVNRLSPEQASLGGQCNPKGRLIFSFVATAPAAGHVRLRIPSSMLAVVQQSLGKYIIFSNAQLQASAAPVIGMFGEGSAEAITTLFGHCPETQFASVSNDLGCAICLGPDCYECWLNIEHAESAWQQLTEYAYPGSQNQWLVQQVRLGLPNVYPETQEEFIPQTINFQPLAGISFTKGCYTGQEIVARMQYLGKQKRHTYRGECNTLECPAPGTPLVSGTKEQSPGKVVLAAHNGTELELLMCLNTPSGDQDEIYLDEQQQRPVALQPLPYSVTNDKDKS